MRNAPRQHQKLASGCQSMPTSAHAEVMNEKAHQAKALMGFGDSVSDWRPCVASERSSPHMSRYDNNWQRPSGITCSLVSTIAAEGAEEEPGDIIDVATPKYAVFHKWFAVHGGVESCAFEMDEGRGSVRYLRLRAFGVEI